MSQRASEWFRSNRDQFSGTLLFEEPLSKYTYYRIGGPAAVFACPKSEADLLWLVEGVQKTGIPYFFVGQGSNLLVSDVGFNGLIIKTSRLNLEICEVASDFPEFKEPYFRLRTGSAVVVSSLLRRAMQEGWKGLEFLAGVPGSIGGVVVMNAGTHLGEAKDSVLKLETYSFEGEPNLSLQKKIYEGDLLQFSYRKNHFLPAGHLVAAVEWKLKKANPDDVKKIIDETLLRRKSTQPMEYPSCGSVFKNPKSSGLSAWQVIDQLKLRGHRIGDAQFAEKHSNFIINLGHARAADVTALIQLAKIKAKEVMAIDLEEEVIYLG